MESEIRLARFPSDADVVRRLFREYEAELGIDLCFQGFEQELETLPGCYAAPAGGILLAYRGEEAVGCGAYRPLGAGRCEMKRLFVQPRIRGSNLGRALVERLVEDASLAGYAEMVLDTLRSMTPARTLYGSLGFEECPSYYPNPLEDVVYMRRALRA